MVLQQYRKSRIQKAMAESGADIIIASAPQHILYLTGFIGLGATYHPKTQNYAIYDPGKDKVYIVVSLSDAATAVEQSPDATIVGYGAFRFFVDDEQKTSYCNDFCNRVTAKASNQAEAIIDILMQCQAEGKVVAWDELRTPITTWNAVAGKFDSTKFIPGLSIFEKARMIKHPEEVKDLERAANIAEDALLGALKDVHEGISEREIRFAYMQKVSALGGDTFFMTSTIDRRTSFSDTIATATQKLRNGSILRFDFGASHNFMCSDLARTAVYGYADPKYTAAYASILEGLEAAEAAMRPGIVGKEIFSVAQKVTQRTLPTFSRHHCGHGIGIMINDVPFISPTSEQVLEPGMVFSVETPYYALDQFGVQIEDMVVITETGIRRLCHTSNDLICL